MTFNRISLASGSTGILAHRARRNFPLAVIVVVLFAAGTLAAAGLTGKIAYSNGNICLFDLATGTNTQFAVSGVNPKVSPDGTRIVFQGSNHVSGIYVMNADGTNPTLISSFGGVPAWSHDGTKIAFHSSGIWVMNADGSGVRQLTSHGRWAAWSPDGSQIAFGSNLDSPDNDLWIVNADGTNARLLLSRRAEDIDVVWSPSFRIIFGGFVDRVSDYEIFAFDPVTSSLSRLTNSPRSDFEPAASPDGSKIAFSSFRKPQGIYIMNADGSSPQLIIAGGRQPSWGP